MSGANRHAGVTIAIDAMGGDRAPAEVVAGAVLAARAEGPALMLVGQRDRVERELRRHDPSGVLAIEVVDAPDVIAMGESPLAALRRKPLSSIRIACDLVASGRAHAIFSAGHTGATLIAAHAAFGLIDGLDRPALAVIVPARKGQVLLLDAGANVECRPEHLVQFAGLGSAYARVAMGIAEPRVGLLSIGEEAEKGNALVRDAHEALTHAPITFVGNVDARALFTGIADVVVCDGFTGNIVLKVGEGAVDLSSALLREELSRHMSSRLGAWMCREAFHRLARRVDETERGAAPLLGVRGLTLVGHGRSSARAVQNAIGAAATLVAARVLDPLADAVRRSA